MANKIDKSKINSFGTLEFLAKQVVEGFITGLHKSPFHGFSVEFAEHRLYNKGESTKHIDWKLYARTEKLFVKRYEEETNLRCHIVIDNSSSMYFPDNLKADQHNKISFSVHAAASLVELLRKQRDAVGLNLFAEKVSLHTKAKSSLTHHKLIYNELEKLLLNYNPKETKKTFTIDALHEIAENIHKRSLVILFSDMFNDIENKEELFLALQHLKHNKHEVILFHVTDKAKELNLNFENRPYTFVDMETGEKVKLNPSQVKTQYQKATSEYKNELKLKCLQFKIDFVEADISEGYNHILLQYLIKRNKLH